MTTLALAGAGSRLWAPVRMRSFRFLWLGQSFSLLGDGFSYIAFAWITLSLSHSTLVLGCVLALQAVPRAALTLVGGSLSDRFSARSLMMMSSWARAAVMSAVAAVALSGLLGIWMILAAAAMFGAVDAFFQPARSSVLPSVVPKDLIEPANALLGVGSRVASVIGPALGGVAVALSDADYAFLVDGVCFALCALCVARVVPLAAHRAQAPDQPSQSAEAAAGTAADRPAADEVAADAADRPPEGAPAGAPDAASSKLLGRIAAGLRYAMSDPRIRTMLVVDMAVTFCYAGPFTVGFASLAKFQLAGGSASLGVLDGALSGGAMLGALAGGAIGRRLPVGLLVAALTGWLAAAMALIGLSHNVVLVTALVLSMGFAIGFEGVFGLSWIQRNIHGDVLSRVIAVDMVGGYIAAPISLVSCGALAETRLEVMFGGVAVILVLVTIAVLSSRSVRTM